MPIKAFVFDCGGVVLRNGDLSPYEVWASTFGTTAQALRQSLWRSELWRRTECGKMTDAEFWQAAALEFGIDDEMLVSDFRRDIWTTWEVDPRVIETIDELRKHYAVSMLSNASDDLERVLKAMSISDRFDHVINSARVHVAKPNPRIFEIMLETIGLEPQQVVFIDDRVENITAAAGAGLHVIWYVGVNELQRRLALYDHSLSFISLS